MTLLEVKPSTKPDFFFQYKKFLHGLMKKTAIKVTGKKTTQK